MTGPLFSIVTINKNNAAGLRLTGNSILRQQDAPQFEWLIIDGASTDASVNTIRAWDNEFIRFISEPDRNKAHAMNCGIERATGRYVWFLHAGDCLSDAHVMRDLARELRSAAVIDLLYGDARDYGIIHKARDFSALLRRPIIQHQAMLYNRATIGDLRFDETLEHASDYAFMLRFQERAKNIHYMPRLLCDLQSTTADDKEQHAQRMREQHHIRKTLLHMPDWQNRIITKLHMMQHYFKTRFPALYNAFNKR